METRTTRLQPGTYYHIYNRGINGAAVFFESKNYTFFLQRFTKYVSPFVKTYAYCLLGNHFHILICVRPTFELDTVITKNIENPYHWHISNAFSSFLQSYTRAMNKMYDRTGALFETPFKRIEVQDDVYFSKLISYIHKNPETHGIIDDFRDYKYSSYHAHLSNQKTNLSREELLEWFGNRTAYVDFHIETNPSEITPELRLD